MPPTKSHDLSGPGPQAADQLAPALLSWFAVAGRKHLPWQIDRTFYRVWVSEIMLQQTQVTTVIPYYERFMQRFPQMHALAEAPIDEVLHLWTGLGYYARARNLQRAAQCIVREFDGKFPDTIDAVQRLPGIGRSTAGAILAISASQRHPILDGNVKRVLTRYFGVAGFPGEAAVEKQLWRLADECTPATHVADYTQAIMDLGATVCVRTRPLCDRCPLRTECVAHRDHRQPDLPTRRLRKARPQREAHIVILKRGDGAVLLERRPPVGLWGGLWTFPQFDDRAAAQSWIAILGADKAPQIDDLASYRHSFTHFDLTLHPIAIETSGVSAVGDEDRYCWYNALTPARIGLAKPAVALIRKLGEIGPRSAVRGVRPETQCDGLDLCSTVSEK